MFADSNTVKICNNWLFSSKHQMLIIVIPYVLSNYDDCLMGFTSNSSGPLDSYIMFRLVVQLVALNDFQLKNYLRYDTVIYKQKSWFLASVVECN